MPQLDTVADARLLSVWLEGATRTTSDAGMEGATLGDDDCEPPRGTALVGGGVLDSG